MYTIRGRLVGTVVALVVPGAVAGCADDTGGTSEAPTASTSTAATTAGTAGTAGTTGTTAGTTPTSTPTSSPGTTTSTTVGMATTSGTTFSFDVGQGSSTGEPPDACAVVDDMDGAPPPCDMLAPPDSFEPDVQWAWAGDGEYTQVMATPLVANLTDDNDDGSIDLCDTPDIVVAVYKDTNSLDARLYVLDGATGAVHFSIDQDVAARTYPALGDIDGDGLPEIVTANGIQGLGQLVAYEHDGAPKWVGDASYVTVSSAIALADLDADGDVEIVHNGHVADHEGTEQWVVPGFGLFFTATAADLDGDDDMEVVVGFQAYHHDGSLYFDAGPMQYGHPHIADLNGDQVPEIMIVTDEGITLLESDGTLMWTAVMPAIANQRPAAIHDMDGDGAAEVVVGAANTYSMLEGDLELVWTANVLDQSGYAAGTAFDFLGDGTAEAMYGDETTLFVFDENGGPLLTSERGSWTQFEYPVVADVDNDGSAEIVVVSNEGYNQSQAPAVQVIRDVEDRWVPARRIWNQHTYHVTNVREDGTIPQVEPKHWELLNTFRTQAQSEGGMICRPPS